MSMSFLKPAGISLMTSQSDTPVKKKRGTPWYIYFGGSTVYTILGGWLAAESSLLAIICIISAPVGFFYAWRAWRGARQS
jgi:hypothetical protein